MGGREVVQRRPLVYQRIGGERREVGSAYAEVAPGEVAVALARYDRSLPLVIDPVLVTSTYLSGASVDAASAVAVDASGAVYLTGWTQSLDFPTVGAAQPSLGGAAYDAFVTKLVAGGTGAVYSTYLGGNDQDLGQGIAVDAAGSAYVAGFTFSTNFPRTAGAFQTIGAPGSANAFVTKLTASGAGLAYSTFLTGTDGASANAIAVDAQGDAYVTGNTLSVDFPVTADAVQLSHAADLGATDAFVTELAPSGGSLVFSTYLGGNGADDGKGIALDGTGHVLVVGSTTSTALFPLLSPYQGVNRGGTDAFVTELVPGGQGLIFSTLLGGAGEDVPHGVAVDAAGAVFVAGSTTSTDFPVLNAFQAAHAPDAGRRDAFVTKLDVGGAPLVFSTYLGGSADDTATGIALDAVGGVFVAGTTGSADLPLVSPLQATLAGGTDAFVARLKASGGVLWSSYLGGTDTDEAAGIAAGTSNDAYVAGQTRSSAFAASSAIQSATAGTSYDAFVSRISSLTLASVSPASGPTAGGTDVTLSGMGFVSGTAVLFDATPAASVIVAGDGSITVTTPAHGEGPVSVSVKTPDGVIATQAAAFTFVAPPVVTAVSPTGGPPAGGTAVTITGTGFVSGATVQFDTIGVPVTFNGSSSLTVTAPAHAAGSVDVMVRNPDGQKSVLAGAFVYGGGPTVTAASPAAGPLAGGTAVTLTGAGFVAGATVTFGGASATAVTVVNASTVTATTPAHAAGAVDVVVTNPDAQAGTLASGFTYAVPPTLSAVVPSSGSSAGGTAVVLVGSAFAPGAAVRFGGAVASGVTFNNATSLSVTTPAHAAGAVDVTVTNPDGQAATVAAAFTYADPVGGSSGSPRSKDLYAASCGHAGADTAGWLSIAAIVALVSARRRRARIALLLLVGVAGPALAQTRPTAAPRPAPRVDVPLPPPPSGLSAQPVARRPEKKERLALMPLRAGIGIDPKLAESVGDSLATAINRRGVSIVSSRDIEAALGFERQKQLLGCSGDTSCLAEMGGALGVDRMVFGGLARFGNTIVLTVQILDARKALVLARAEEKASASAEERLLEAIDRVAWELFPPSGAGVPPPAPPPASRDDGGWELGVRMSGSLTQVGGAAAVLAGYRPAPALSLAAGPTLTASGAPGAVARVAWTPLRLSPRVGVTLAAEGLGYYDKALLAGAAASAGLEVTLGSRLVLALDVPAVYLLAAPADYRRFYVTPGVTAAWRM